MKAKPAVRPRRRPSSKALASNGSDLCGIFGHPYIDLGALFTDERLAAVDREVSLGLARVESAYTGGTLKWMGVVAPWARHDAFLDAMDVIEKLSEADYRVLVSLADDPARLESQPRRGQRFGDETDNPLSMAQARWLSYRHGVYFPWKVCYHLLENDSWEDKHRATTMGGDRKSFGDEAREVFPETVALIESLPFTEVGRAVIFGLEPNDHAPLHRDSEPGVALSVAQSISICPRGDKRFFLQNSAESAPIVVGAKAYWFNDMDYHGVFADPFFRYSIRVDGVFEPGFLARMSDR